MRFSESGRLGWLKGECFDYDNLKSSSYSNRCIEVSKTLNELVWNMQNCDQALRFICEKLKKEVTNPKCEDYSEDLVHGNTLPNKKYYIGRETVSFFLLIFLFNNSNRHCPYYKQNNTITLGPSQQIGN